MIRNKRFAVFAVWVVCFGFGYSQISTTAVTATLKAYSDARTGKPVFEFILKNNLGTELTIPTYFEPYEAGMVSRKTKTYLYIYKSEYVKTDPIPVFVSPSQRYYKLLPGSEYKITLQGLDEYGQLTPENIYKAVLVMGYAYNGYSYPSKDFPVIIDKTPPATRVPVDRTQPTEPVDGSRR